MPDRREDAARLQQLADAARRAEAAEAQRLIDAFVEAARERGLAPEPLRATLYGGVSVRTDKVGWYLNSSRSVAIGYDGSYYQLVVGGGVRERLRGVRLEASEPSLVIGRGARDGESGDLAEFLARVLDRPAP